MKNHLSNQLSSATVQSYTPGSWIKSRPELSTTQLRIWPGGYPQLLIFMIHGGRSVLSRPKAFCNSELHWFRKCVSIKIETTTLKFVRLCYLIRPGTQSGNSPGLTISSSEVASWYRFLQNFHVNDTKSIKRENLRARYWTGIGIKELRAPFGDCSIVHRRLTTRKIVVSSTIEAFFRPEIEKASWFPATLSQSRQKNIPARIKCGTTEVICYWMWAYTKVSAIL